jgi:hypothetical protein
MRLNQSEEINKKHHSSWSSRKSNPHSRIETSPVVDIVFPVVGIGASAGGLDAIRKFNTSKEETENKSIFEINDRSWDIPALRKLLEDILPENTVFNDFEVEMEFPGIGCKKMQLNARRIYEEGAGIERILLAIEDVTEQSGRG